MITANSAALRAAMSDAEEILSRQRQSLDALGLLAPKNLSFDTAQRLSAQARDWRDHGSDLLRLSLAEIAARQALLDDAVSQMISSDIAVGALTHAMHRIRTSIDVALGCSEEAEELSYDPDVRFAAAESAAALRLIYHYTNELRDLSSLRAVLADEDEARIDCNATLDQTVRHLAHVARDAHVALCRLPAEGPLLISTRAGVLARALSYGMLNAIVSPGVSRVTYGIRVSDNVEFVISHNGQSATLEERAFIRATPTSNAHDCKDGSGFAVVRRLAKALGGHLVLETHPEAGDTLTIAIPKQVDPSRLNGMQRKTANLAVA